MSVFLWVLAVLLAVVLGVVGVTHLTTPKATLLIKPNMGWTEDFSERTIKVIGLLEVLAAVGLVVPALLGVAPGLVAAAALGLILLMAGAIVTHRRRGERQPIVINIVLLAMAAVVARGRIGPYAF